MITIDAMKHIPPRDVPHSGPLRRPVYHECGLCLFEAGDEISERHFALLRLAGIRAVYYFDKMLDGATRFFEEHTRKEVPTVALGAGDISAAPVIGKNGRVLIGADQAFTEKHVQLLLKERIEKVVVKKTDQERRLAEFERFGRLRSEFEDESTDISHLQPPEEPQPPAVQARTATRRPEDLRVAGGKREETGKTRLLKRAAPGGERRELYRVLFKQSSNGMREMLRALSRGKEVSGEAVGVLSRNLVRAAVNDADLLLNFVNLRKRGGYQAPHSLNVAILSVCMGIELGYDTTALTDLGAAALLHDLGMLATPAEIVAKRDALTQKERAEIKKHPEKGLEVLERVRGFPGIAAVVILQEHERGNGSGYPRGLLAKQVHDLARVVAVADVYDALITRRTYRDAQTPFKTLADIEQMVNAGILFAEPARALIAALSRFPVGSWVELSDGSVAKVVGANRDDPLQPTVAVLTSVAKSAYRRVNLAKTKSTSVARAIESHERTLDQLLEGF